MFRIIDRRIRSASSKFEKLENSAEAALARAQQTAARSLSLRSRSNSRPPAAQQEADTSGGGRHSRTLLGLLSPRNWNNDGPDRPRPDAEDASEEAHIATREMNYVEMQCTDTLEGIAAAHDTTVGVLVKLNKLTSRMVFPGQKLLVPSVDGVETVSNGKMETKGSKKLNETVHKGPGYAVRTTSGGEEDPKQRPISEPNNSANLPCGSRHQSTSTTATRRSNAELGRMASDLDPDDQECLQRFLKIRVKQVTESDGTIVGTLLVTPNCLMFDPDTEHPLVQEKGSDLYGMVANMEDIVSVTVYKNISSLTGDKCHKEEDIFDPKNVVTGSPKKSVCLGTKETEEEIIPSARRQSDAKSIPKPNNSGAKATGNGGQVVGMDDGHNLVYGTSAGCLLLGSSLEERNAAALLGGGSTGESSLSNSEQQLPCIDEENEVLKKDSLAGSRGPAAEKRRTVSDMQCQHRSSTEDVDGSKDSASTTQSVESEWPKSGDKQSGSLDLHSSLDVVEGGEGAARERAHSNLEQTNSVDSNRLRSGEPNPHRRSPSPFSRYSPGMARKSFGKLGRTLSAKATSIKGTVQSGAQTVATGTQKVAHGVVSHTLSAADHIQTGIQTSAKMVASVPGSIVNVSAGLLQDGQNGVMEVVDQLKALAEQGGEQQKDRSPMAMKRERSMATLESLCQRTQQAREQAAVQRAQDTGLVLGSEERPVLGDEEGVGEDEGRPIGTPPDPPYYMIVRVDRRRKRKRARTTPCSAVLRATNSGDLVPDSNGGHHANSTVTGAAAAADLLFEEGCAFGNKRKREFWFAIPRNRVDSIYHFLLQWSPQKYGQEKASTADETNEIGGPEEEENNSGGGSTMLVTNSSGTAAKSKQHLGGFVVLDGDVDDTLAGEKPSDHFGRLNREWEVVTVRELCRRLSLEDSLEPSEMPLPEGAGQSQMLDEFMIRQIVDILPPRAEGYPWVNIYNSEKHGFSLATLYRKMTEWNEEMSPVLLVVRDVNGHVFGAVTSTLLRPADHYYGTGDSCLLFRFTGEYPHTRELRTYTWTGSNQFFVNATKSFLSFGAGGGHYGLWLDADLNHGRSQKCATFDNEPLAGGQDEDFVVQFVEAFGFSM